MIDPNVKDALEILKSIECQHADINSSIKNELRKAIRLLEKGSRNTSRSDLAQKTLDILGKVLDVLPSVFKVIELLSE